MWTHVKAAISQCSSTLTTIVIQGCFCPSDGIMEHYSCTALHSCRNLKDLQLSVGLLFLILPNQITVYLLLCFDIYWYVGVWTHCW